MGREKMTGLKARDLDKDLSGKNLLNVAKQGPVFYRVTVEQFVFDTMAIRRRSGLEKMIGNASIADALGTDEDVAVLMSTSTRIVGLKDAMDLPVVAMLEE